jgi:hypothetical protein
MEFYKKQYLIFNIFHVKLVKLIPASKKKMITFYPARWKAISHLADFMELPEEKNAIVFFHFWTQSQSAGALSLTSRPPYYDAGEGGDVRGGGRGARAGGGGGGEAARRVAARAGPAPAPRGGAVAAGAVAAEAARGLPRRRRRDGGALHRARAVRGAGRAAEELRRLPRLQQAPQGLLAPRLVQQLITDRQLPLLLKWKKKLSAGSSLIMSEFGYHLAGDAAKQSNGKQLTKLHVDSNDCSVWCVKVKHSIFCPKRGLLKFSNIWKLNSLCAV